VGYLYPLIGLIGFIVGDILIILLAVWIAKNIYLDEIIEDEEYNRWTKNMYDKLRTRDL